MAQPATAERPVSTLVEENSADVIDIRTIAGLIHSTAILDNLTWDIKKDTPKEEKLFLLKEYLSQFNKFFTQYNGELGSQYMELSNQYEKELRQSIIPTLESIAVEMDECRDDKMRERLYEQYKRMLNDLKDYLEIDVRISYRDPFEIATQVYVRRNHQIEIYSASGPG
ncbi:MAG: hypothetical protein U9O94_01725 [Nanoarchaeota archaeon]|nr:hypothetical protein [Nanoarchaeota archaeon]